MIRKAAVLGAGTMGSRIAAHLANAGLPVVLLDIPTEGRTRSAIAVQALDALKKSKPAAFYDPAYAARITVGNFDDDMALLADCDWVIEAVTENLAIKQALLDKVVPHLKRDAILTTNTSGLPVASIAAKLPEAVRRRWFGTHFFNPPRYMRLVEIIPTPETDPAAIEAISHFADVLLGKEVVFARDTPNFIANRIGVFIMLEAVRLMQEEDLTIEEVDALTGTAIGWPRTGTFRLADMVGIDVLAHVAANFEGSGAMPPFVRTMLERKWLGDKARQGFYKKEKDAAGKEVRLVLDWKTLEYVPAIRPKIPSLEMAKNAEQLHGSTAPTADRRCPQGQSCALPLAVCSAPCGTMRRIACRRLPTMCRAWTAPCAPGSTGRWGPSNSGMRPVCPRPYNACRMPASG